jgi:hypothetical protein
MAGHLGAAVTAGYFFGEDHPDVDSGVVIAIEKQLDRIIRGEESLWFDPKKAGITNPQLFQPFPEEQPHEEQPHEEHTSSIATALSGNIEKTRQSGHNVIFAAIALRGLRDHPIYATPSIIEGIRKLVQAFNGAPPGRGYYGKQRGWIVGDKVALPDNQEFPPYVNHQAMAEVVIDELIRSVPERRRGFGGLIHLINHATALNDLKRFGYADLAQKGLAAHHHHVRLWRSLPDVEEELGPLRQADHDPRTLAYWRSATPSQFGAWLTHRIKTMYGFFRLLPFIRESAKRKKAEERFLYLMA